VFNRVMKEPRRTRGWLLGSCILAGGAGLFALACGTEQQATSPELPGVTLGASISSSNFQQCANGDNGGETCTYINGVLNDSKSLYHESEVIAERFVIPSLTVGHTYRLAFDYGWEKAVNPGHMNYDFLAGWNTTLGALANPCGDPLGNPSADIRAVCNTDHTIKATHDGANADFEVVPDAVFTANAPVGLTAELQAAIDRFQTTRGADAVRFNILGGSFPGSAFDNVSYTVSGDDITGRLTVRFVAGQTTVMLLWGGHFADIRDYRVALWDDDKNTSTPQNTGNLTGASGQTGAPFQFSQVYLKDQTSGDSTGIGALSNNIQGSVLEPVPHAKISIAPSDTNGIGELHTFTVTLQKDLDDGAGYIAAAGEHVSVVLSPTGVASVIGASSTCDDAGANTNSSGQCTLTIRSTTADSITATASATLSLNGTSVTLTTDGTGDNSLPAFKIFLDGTLEWLKHDGNNTLLNGAVFTVCRLQKWDSDLNSGAGALADTTDVCFDVTDDITTPDDTDAPPGDRDGTGGEFKLGGLLLGQYSVKEKTAPAGYTIDADSEVVTLSTTSDSVKIATAFVNIAPPVLKITKVPDASSDVSPDGTVHPGGTAVFKITVKNDVATGGGTATGVSMTDTLPAGLTWTDDKNECVIDQVTFGSPSATHDRVICTIGDLAAQASFTVTLSATVPNNILQIPPSPAGSAIEIDGDLVDDNGVAGHDWATLPDSVFKCTGNPATSVGCAADRPTGRTDNSFGQGTKEDTPVPKVVSGSIPNNKSDLLRFYVSRERFGSTDFLYLAWSRVQEPSGTTNMDFELNQSKTLSSNHTTPVRTAGDILVRYDLAQGGTVPVLGFHRWITSGSATNCEASNALPCWDKFHALNTDVKGAINSGTITDPIANTSLSPRTFGEASIDLPASGIFQAGVCANFASAYLKSRSSASFGSEIKDFIAPITANITNCAPVTLNNKAWAEADNFTPSGGSLGDPISDTGKIEVTEDTSASLNVDRTSEQFARKPELTSLVEG
jgi:uncharacterized repeat protein (TIGR01451 family)